jgi:predicted transcriptional regulator
MVLTKLTEILENRGMAIEELAAKTLLSAKTIYNAKKGRGVSLNTGKRIAKTLRLDLSQLQ